MGVNIRFEEYSPLGDFLLASFVKKQEEIERRFPRLDAPYLAAFQAKAEVVRGLESKLVYTENLTNVTATLYAEAKTLSTDLNFLSAYMSDANLSTNAVSDLKKSLTGRDIEGALLEMNGVIQSVRANRTVLESEGMDSRFVDDLEESRVSLAAKNNLQNSILNERKDLVDANKGDYDELYAFIANVAAKGKLVFKGTVTEEEFKISKIISRMRAPKRKDDTEPTA